MTWTVVCCPKCGAAVTMVNSNAALVKADAAIEVDPELLNRPVAEVAWGEGFPNPQRVRIMNALISGGVKTLGDLIEKSEAELMRTPNFGRISVRQIESALNKIGLKLQER